MLDKPTEAAESLGNIDMNYYLTRLSSAFEDAGDKKEAAEVLDTLAGCLEGRKVADPVLAQVKAARSALGVPATEGAARSGKQKRKPSSGK